MDLRPGLSFGRYVLSRRIGTGGMSEVWAARDGDTGRLFALKILRTSEASDELSAARFQREVHAMRSIRHPAIVPALEVLRLDGGRVLVMELLDGETLRALLEREGRLTPERTAALLLPVASALALAHEGGIVHRDLKPENIFVQRSADGATRVRLLDFGVARFYEPPPGTEHAPTTALGALVGTMAYMAPEQALAPSGCDHRVDVWALGVVLYEALSGCRPVEGSSEPDILRQLLVGAITPLEVVVPGLPDLVTSLVASMLVRAPERRLERLEAVTIALSRLQEGLEDDRGPTGAGEP